MQRQVWGGCCSADSSATIFAVFNPSTLVYCMMIVVGAEADTAAATSAISLPFLVVHMWSWMYTTRLHI